MTPLNADDFDRFFREVWGVPPFAWQQALVAEVLAAHARPDGPTWPACLALPTAAGKTACLDIAVFALAAQAGAILAGQLSRAPRRIFLVVDRRVIVDEARQRAERLAAALAQATEGVVHDVAQRLRSIADGPLPLAVQSLRGGQLRSDDWAASPLQPSVITSTVDQVGSRLLFRGYGVSSGMWPVHAGLVGNDALILLDEAHCAQPMLETLQAVQRYRAWSQGAPLPPLEVSVLSATPPTGLVPVSRDTSDQPGDAKHTLGKRLLASKPARLLLVEKPLGRDPRVVRVALADRLVASMRELLTAPVVGVQGAPAAVVFCNRVDTARRVHAALQGATLDVHLLTGRMRPLDRDEALATVLAPLSSALAEARNLGRPCVVVTTQTLEVGADLDFDLLVTECASLDALRQRFGRLNRGGRPIAARAVIAVASGQLDEKADDPVYGAALRLSWQALRAWAGASASLDMGVSALQAHLTDEVALQSLCAPVVHAPILLPVHLDALAQTAPAPQPSPDVSLFLHGARSGPADVQVCWRADLDPADPMAALDSVLRCPPSAPECASVPFVLARAWLNGTLDGEGADVEGEAAEPPGDAGDAPRTVLRWGGRAHSTALTGGADLRPGDLLIIPARLGGMHELLACNGERVLDLGDQAHAVLRQDAVLRLHNDVMSAYPGASGKAQVMDLAAAGRAGWDADPTAFVGLLRDTLQNWAAELTEPRWQWLRSILDLAASMRRMERCLVPHPAGGWILEVPRPRPATAIAAAIAASTHSFFSDEDDVASSGHVRSLLVDPMQDGRSHLEGVGALARRHAALCGLPSELVAVIGQSGDGHDLGKADPRFQAMLQGGMPWLAGPLLAKSAAIPQGREGHELARVRAGYPVGGRHELLSVRLLESCATYLPADPVLRDLLLHLVESHHGHCRPFAPVVQDTEPVTVCIDAFSQSFTASSDTALHRLDAGPPDRFWRLTRLYGWWGLAWFEALLRLADHRRSAWERLTAGGTQ